MKAFIVHGLDHEGDSFWVLVRAENQNEVIPKVRSSVTVKSIYEVTSCWVAKTALEESSLG